MVSSGDSGFSGPSITHSSPSSEPADSIRNLKSAQSSSFPLNVGGRPTPRRSISFDAISA